MRTNFEKLLAVVISVCMLASLLALPTVAAVSVWDGTEASASLSGSGTAADPYLIKSAADLKYFADQVNGGTDYSGKVIYLKNDIDLDNQPFTPIGNTAKYFRGQFDGKNHTVSGVNITTSNGNGTGLFGALHNGWIKNLHVEGSIINTYNSGACNIGGIVGTTSGGVTIFNCSFEGLIRSANTNQNCFFLAGGIVGGVNATTTAGVKIDNCYSSGTIDAFGNAGGLVGALANDTSNKLIISNSYSDALMTGSSAGTSTFDSAGTAAGLLGVMQNGTVTMTDCFFAGWAPYKRGSGMCGPVVNNKAGGTLTLTRVYYDNEKNLLNGGTFAAAVDGTGQTTNFMAYSLWGYFPNSFIAGNGILKHPLLRLAEMGSGTMEDPYVVDSASDLKLISDICGTNNVYNFRDDYIKFGADIDLNNAAFTPIGSQNMYFRGIVDGKGHTVSNLSITKNTNLGVGFFGGAGGTTIKNLNVSGTVTNNYRPGGPVAGLIGKTADNLTVINCSFNGTVYSANTLVSTGSGYSPNDMNYISAAGLICEVGGNVTVNYCSVSGTIDGFGRSGGLIGSLNAASYKVTVNNSYCDADVTGKGPVDSSLSNFYTGAGFVGFLGAGTMSFTNCFFAGTFPAARATNNMAGPIINHNAGGTFTCTNVYYLSDTAVETYGENKNAAWFASEDAATALGGSFAADTPHPVFAEPSYNGSGTEDDPYLLTSAADLQELKKLFDRYDGFDGYSFKLTSDLELNENHADYESWASSAPANNWTPIGTAGKQFAGNFDGAGHSVYGMYCSYPEADTGVGFFGGTYRGTIKDLHIKDSYVCAVNQVGGFTGSAQESNFENCSFEGYVKATNTTNPGGSASSFIGNAGAGNVITKCYTGGVINAFSRSGGLIGAAPGNGVNYIYDSYSTVDHAVAVPSGDGEAYQYGMQHGGLVGLVQNGTINLENCFYLGDCPHGGTTRGYIIGQSTTTPNITNCYYVADPDTDEYGTAITVSALTDGTLVTLLQDNRTATVWIQGENYPIFEFVGDVDGDGFITVGDALLVLRHIENVDLLANTYLADMDSNGSINANDYLLIKIAALDSISGDAAPVINSNWSQLG